MPTQYTIRNVPKPVNLYLRKKAKISGKSLNQVVIDKLSEDVSLPSEPTGIALDWFIGSGMDEQTLKALKEEEKRQKRLAAKELFRGSRH